MFGLFVLAARREPGASDVLGHQEPAPSIGDDGGVGRLVRERLFQGQPQPALQHERIRGKSKFFFFFF